MSRSLGVAGGPEPLTSTLARRRRPLYGESYTNVILHRVIHNPCGTWPARGQGGMTGLRGLRHLGELVRAPAPAHGVLHTRRGRAYPSRRRHARRPRATGGG